MAGSTRFFGLAFFDFNDKLDDPLNVQKEIDRFVLIDKQLYGLYSIFGNGVINGWDVSDNGFSEADGISVAISPGSGIIRSIASETTFPDTVTGLPPLSTFDIYAVLQGSTVRDREIDFVYSFTALGDFAIKLAEVSTGNNGVISINNNIRELIGFKQIIEDEINAHKHRGTPSKIDLQKETKNQLPGALIEGIDANKIISGTLPLERLPIIDHEDLNFNGLLTHAQLDSFVKTLSESNKELLGEVSSVNLMKHIIFMKYKFSNIDDHFVNELAIIPGISPDSFIDFEESTSQINLDQKCISGKPPKVGEFSNIEFNTRSAFQNAFKKTNVDIKSNGVVTLEQDELVRDVIEDFESVSDSGNSIPGFSLTNEVVVDNFDVVSEDTDSLRVDGFYSGKFSANRKFRSLFTKEFSSTRDWTDFDELIVNVKTLSVSHGAVFAYFVNTVNNVDSQSPNFLLLADDEVTDNPDASRNDFEKKSFDISNLDRNNVSKFVIFTDDTSDAFEFYLDEMYVQNKSLYKSQGTIKLRYSTGSPVTFHSLFFDIDEPENTSSLVRVKVANSESLLSRSSFTLGLNDGQVFALTGTHVEIDITLFTEDKSITPELLSTTLRILVDSENHGFNVDDSLDWSAGSLQNLDIINTSGTKANVQISDPINFGGIYFSTLESISEIDDKNIGVLGFSGVNMPISLPQAYGYFESPLRGFDNPVSVKRTIEKNFIIADTDNDRVLLVDSQGSLVKGFTGIAKAESTFFPAIAAYNDNNGILSIAFSRDVDRDSVDISEMSLFLGSTEIKLGSNDSIISSSKIDQILEIQLSSDKQSQISSQSSLKLNFSSGAFVEDVSTSEQAGALIGSQGLDVFVGDMTFVDFIKKPIFADILENDNWIVCNGDRQTEVEDLEQTSESTQEVNDLVNSLSGTATTATSRTLASIVEFAPNEDNEIEFTYSDINFSVYSLGGLIEIPLNRFAVAGISASNISSSSEESTDDSSDSEKTFYKIEYRNTINGNLSSASNVTLESEDGEYGVREKGTETIIVEAGTSLVQESTGVYSYSFEADSGKSFDAFVKVIQNSGDDPVYIEVNPKDTSLANDFNQQAQNALSGKRGKVITIDRTTSQKRFEYTSPDGLYPADVSMSSDGDLVIAESDFENNSGRVIKLDSFGNIVFEYGRGNLGIVKDAKALDNGSYILSL